MTTAAKPALDVTRLESPTYGAGVAVAPAPSPLSVITPKAKRPVRFLMMATAPQAVALFLTRQIAFLKVRGYEIHTLASTGLEEAPQYGAIESIHHEVAMHRTMHPFADIPALYKIWRLMRKLRPDMVQTHTPKAGLLGMIAATLAGVPIRIYTVNGLPLFTQKGLKRLIVAFTDWLACSLATEVICPSRCLRRFIVSRGICRRGKAKTLGDGGFPGVDPWKYHPDKKLRHRALTRRKYGIPQQALVFGYIGRIVPDKGIAELTAAWQSLREEFPQSHLLLCGHFEDVHPVPPEIVDVLQNDPRVHFTGWVTDMPPIYAAIDICALPTYREAISGVVLEAGAMEIPVVTTRVPGSVDSLANGVTAMSIPAQDGEALRDAMAKLARDGHLRRRMGMAARAFVSERFSHDKIFDNLYSEYERLIKKHLPESAPAVV